jgi:hypothetical protein
MNTLIIIVVALILLWFFMKPRHERKCAWCSSYKITFITGTEGIREWKYSNKDGSRDKRRKDNFEQATYTSEHKCNECNASTKYLHKESKSPGPSKNILKRELLNNGEGERKGSDYGV